MNDTERIAYLALMLLATYSLAACREQPSGVQMSAKNTTAATAAYAGLAARYAAGSGSAPKFWDGRDSQDEVENHFYPLTASESFDRMMDILAPELILTRTNESGRNSVLAIMSLKHRSTMPRSRIDASKRGIRIWH